MDKLVFKKQGFETEFEVLTSDGKSLGFADPSFNPNGWVIYGKDDKGELTWMYGTWKRRIDAVKFLLDYWKRYPTGRIEPKKCPTCGR